MTKGQIKSIALIVVFFLTCCVFLLKCVGQTITSDTLGIYIEEVKTQKRQINSEEITNRIKQINSQITLLLEERASLDKMKTTVTTIETQQKKEREDKERKRQEKLQAELERQNKPPNVNTTTTTTKPKG